MDFSTMDPALVFTSLLGLLTALGTAGVVVARGKFVGAIGIMADMLTDVSMLLVAITDAAQDDTITPEEWTKIRDKALEVKGHGQALVTLFGK